VIVVGGHTRSIGKTQLVCEIISALPAAKFVAGKITQYGHGVCAQNGEHCHCAPEEHSSVFDWEHDSSSGTDSSRFLAAGARRSFWLRTKQGYLAEGLPLLRDALETLAQAETALAPANLIVESNSLLQFLKPSLYITVLDPAKVDFKPSALAMLDRADAVVLRRPLVESSWSQVSAKLLEDRPTFLQLESQAFSSGLLELIERSLAEPLPSGI
jgi:hypothetical protein